MKKKTAQTNWYYLAGSIFFCLLAGFVGSFFTVQSVGNWYLDIAKPSFNPPSWVFGPVWTTLYILMGISLYRILSLKWSKKVSVAVCLFVVQLALNIAWSYFFFGSRNLWMAFADIVVLWLAIFDLIGKFAKLDKLASILLYPYLAWVSFASILNLAIAWLNR